ncbi:MAG: aminoacyl-histidine dipeptidase [Desulfobacterales bacterium]|nr:aminoacyl-histidine dipeptidase [Desulfobacterales bacterium]
MKEILDIFEKISSIPRCSKNEGQISQWLCEWAKDNGFKWNSDKSGNIVMNIPATKGYENSPILILQSHMDMVCEKNKESSHDFSKDPIKLVYDGDWVTASETSLGADNGIGMAIALAIGKDKTIEHPDIELLFTVDEETGLNGANALDPDILKGRILINLDTEDDEYFIIGCSGGNETKIALSLEYAPLPENYGSFVLKVDGIMGGHSGIDINKHRANAIQILTRALYESLDSVDFRLISIKGGSAHNAIPREASAIIAFDSSLLLSIKKAMGQFYATVQNEFSSEKKISVSIAECLDQYKDAALSFDTKKAVNLLMALPHGVYRLSELSEKLVETSNNLAIVDIKNNSLEILTSQRSSIVSRLSEITNKIEATVFLSGGKANTGRHYPPWYPDFESKLLKRCKQVYQDIFLKDPIGLIVHAGLEAGIIASKFDEMDVISCGPKLENPHSPNERLNISSIHKVWTFLTGLLKSYGNQ